MTKSAGALFRLKSGTGFRIPYPTNHPRPAARALRQALDTVLLIRRLRAVVSLKYPK